MTGTDGPSNIGSGHGSLWPPGGSIAQPADSKGGWAFGCAQTDSGLSNSQEGQPGLHFNLVLESWSRSGPLPASCGSGAWSCSSKFPP